MCITILTDKIIIARKEYMCDAFYDIIHASLSKADIKDILDKTDFKLYLEAEKKNFKILIGEKYRYYTFPNNGTIEVRRESLIGNSLCIKYNLYDEC